MGKITTKNNYGSVDYLDDIELHDGERLRFRWPDDTFDEHTIRVEENRHYGFPGFSDHHYTKLAYIQVKHRGLSVKVSVTGLHADRLEAPKFRVGDVVHFIDGRYATRTFKILSFTYAALPGTPSKSRSASTPRAWTYLCAREPIPTPKPSAMTPSQPQTYALEGEIEAWQTVPLTSARTVALECLATQPCQSMYISELVRVLTRAKVLGFGVEALDVINALYEDGKVHYDRDTELVTLRPTTE